MLQLIHSVVAHVGDLGTALLRQPLVAYTLLPIVTDVQLRLDTIFEGQPAHTIVGITFVFSLLFVAAWRFLFASDERTEAVRAIRCGLCGLFFFYLVTTCFGITADPGVRAALLPWDERGYLLPQ